MFVRVYILLGCLAAWLYDGCVYGGGRWLGCGYGQPPGIVGVSLLQVIDDGIIVGKWHVWLGFFCIMKKSDVPIVRDWNYLP